MFPKELRRLKTYMAALGTSSYSCAPLPQQYAAIKAFSRHPSLEQYLKNTQAVLSFLSIACQKEFSKLDIYCFRPRAAWYLLLDFEKHRNLLESKGITSSKELAIRLVEEIGMVFVPGEAFGLDSKRYFLRASYVDFNGSEAVNALTSSDFENQMRENIAKHLFSGFAVLSKWLES